MKYTIANIPGMRANLRKVYAQATDAEREAGRNWYPEAERIIREWALHYALRPRTVAAVVAALSPQCRWERNLVAANDVLSQQAISLGGPLNVNIAKARAILDDNAESTLPYFKSAPKVASFEQNLLGESDYVTVDTHAAQAALGDGTAVISLKWAAYMVFAQAYAEEARAQGVPASAFQATIWLTWKRLYTPEDKRAATRRNKVTKYRR